MLKQFSAFILILAFAAQTFNQLTIVVDYYANTAAYAKNCENKAKPMLHCNGRCQMMKKLKQEENKDKQNPERRNDNKDEVLFFSKNSFNIQNSNFFVVKQYPIINSSLTKDISLAFFKPPKAA